MWRRQQQQKQPLFPMAKIQAGGGGGGEARSGGKMRMTTKRVSDRAKGGGGERGGAGERAGKILLLPRPGEWETRKGAINPETTVSKLIYDTDDVRLNS